MKSFDKTVLDTLHDLGETYGVPLHEALEADSLRFVSLGSVYAALDRLEDEGLIISWMGEATIERGGRKKKYFKVTEKGEVFLEELRSE